MHLVRKPVARRGFTLLEIAIATVVMGLAILPLIGLMTQGRTNEQSDERMGEAVSLAELIMEQLLSLELPFAAIDPGGGGLYVAGGPTSNTNQAGFVDTQYNGQSFTAAKMEKIVNDDASQTVKLGNDRFRFRTFHGKTYYICFFAGRYPDKDPVKDTRESNSTVTYNRADISNTLTFSAAHRPCGFGQPYNFQAADAVANRQVILASLGSNGTTSLGCAAIPYLLAPFQVAQGTTATVGPAVNGQAQYFYHDQAQMGWLRPGYTLVSGWPRPMATNTNIKYDVDDDPGQRALWANNLVAVVESTTGVNVPSVSYHPRVVDQRTVQQNGGALMKIAIGVLFFPYQNSVLRRDSLAGLREFWLVSLKANLQN
jgi:prepilin-type N-terminal cleavage/methylation domain-containing protein